MSRKLSPVDRYHMSLSEAYEGMRQSYASSKTNRFTRRRPGIGAICTSADYHFGSEHEYFKIVELARDLERNDTVISQALRRLVANVVQDGFKPDPNTGDETLDNDLKGMWHEWATDREQVTTSQELNWQAVEKLALYQTLVDGDITLLPTKRGQLEVMECHRLRTPRTKRNVMLGVLMDEHRKRLQYWFTKESIDPMRSTATLRVGDVKPINVRDSAGNRQVFHLYHPKRYSQTRGVSVLQPIIPFIGMLDDLQFAKLVQAQAVSAWCILRELPEQFVGSRADPSVNAEGTPVDEALDGTLKGIAVGMEVTSKNGEKISGFAPNVPNPSHFDHTSLILNVVSVNLDMPLAVFMLDPSETNFSGWRGAIDQARLGWKWWQQWLASNLHTPTYQWKLRQWIAGDAALRAAADSGTVDIFNHGWHKPTWPYIEPLKDASVDVLRDRNGQTSKRRLHGDKGIEWTTLAREIVEDNGLAITLAKTAAAEINGQFPEDDKVHWRELISLPTPDGTQVNLSDASGQNEREPERSENGE